MIDDTVLIFLHIPKCGGTTLNRIMDKAYGAALCDHHVIGDAFLQMSADDLSEYRAYIGHLRYGVHKQFARPARYISLFRDPLDNFVSFYNHVTNSPDHFMYPEVKDMTIHEFFAFLDADEHPVVRNRQCLHICNEPSFDEARRYVDERYFLCAPLEFFDAFAAELSERLSWPPIDWESENISLKKVTPVELEHTFKEKIYDRNFDDLRLFHYVREKFLAGNFGAIIHPA